MDKSGTLCSSCKLACGKHRCSWADHFEPVPGWEAEQTFGQDGEPYSYHVRECPLYAKGRRQSNSPESLDDDGCLNLVGTLIRHAEIDYVKIKRERDEIEEWLRSRESANLFAGLEIEALIKRFRREAARYELEKKIIRKNLWRIWGKNWEPKETGPYQAIIIFTGKDGKKHAKLTEVAWKRNYNPDRRKSYDWQRLPAGERLYAWRKQSGAPQKLPDLPEGVVLDV